MEKKTQRYIGRLTIALNNFLSVFVVSKGLNLKLK